MRLPDPANPVLELVDIIVELVKVVGLVGVVGVDIGAPVPEPPLPTVTGTIGVAIGAVLTVGLGA